MFLAKLLKEGVVCFLEEDTQKNALRKLVDALADAGEVSNKEVFFEAIQVFDRKICSGTVFSFEIFIMLPKITNVV